MQVLQAVNDLQATTETLIEKLLTSSNQNDILNELGNHLAGWEKVQDISIMNQAKILYYVSQAWDMLDTEATSQWQYEFYKWAKQFTKRRNQEPAKLTIDNKITVYRDYVGEGLIEPPEKVFIPKRDDRGKIVEEEYVEVETPSFIECDYSKLLVARATAKRREMTPESWGALFDPYQTVEDLQHEIKDSVDKWNTRKKDDFRLFEDQGVIYACSGGETVGISHLLVEELAGPAKELWKRGVSQLLGGIEVHTPVWAK